MSKAAILAQIKREREACGYRTMDYIKPKLFWTNSAIHQMKLLADQIDEKTAEIKNLVEENKRLAERINSEKLRADHAEKELSDYDCTLKATENARQKAIEGQREVETSLKKEKDRTKFLEKLLSDALAHIRDLNAELENNQRDNQSRFRIGMLFDGCRTIVQATKRRNALMKIYHPDQKEAASELMTKNINSAYDEFCRYHRK